MLLALLLIAVLGLFLGTGNRAPTIIRVTVGPSTAVADQLLNFNVQASDPDSDALTYAWDFGDGTSGSGDAPKHAYSLPGNYIAIVTVTDGKGGEVTNDGNLLSILVNSKPSDLVVPTCVSASCKPGPVVAVLSADRPTAKTGSPVRFYGNSSWAYAFSWNSSANHSQGGVYSPVVASQNASLFALVRYSWGDGTANASGTSDSVGEIPHTFPAPGSYFVRLTVLYVNADLSPSTKTASAGYTERVTLAAPLQSAAAGARLVETATPGSLASPIQRPHFTAAPMTDCNLMRKSGRSYLSDAVRRTSECRT